MIALEILTWWYGRGWAQVVKKAEARFMGVSHLFSVPILVRTWFAPWKRIITYPGSTIEARLHALGDNLVSRVVGFTVRTFVLFTAAIMLLLTMLYGGIQLLVWPLIPIAIVVVVVKGITG